MKRFVCLLISITVMLLLSACISDGGDRGAARGPSGRIVIYTSIYEDVIASLKRVLQRQFPNVQIEFIYGGTGQIQARIAAERARGRLGADILMVAEPAYSSELKEQGLLHSFISQQASNLAFDYDPYGYWYPVRVSNMVLAFNPQRYGRGSVPGSFYEFANDERFRGVIAMSNPLTSGTTKAAITALRDRYGYEFFQALGRQNVAIESGVIALSRLQSGERRAIMVLEESVLRKRQLEMSALEVIYPSDGSIMIPSPIMIVDGRWSANNNTDVAEMIVDWFLGPEGQHAIVDGWMHSVRRDFGRIPFGSIPLASIQANNMPFSWENSLRDRGEILRRFEEQVIGIR